MWWITVLLLTLAALIGYTVWLNAGPTRCPACRRINIFRRMRTGRQEDGRDTDGDLRRRATEYVCGRCGGHYWLVWDDFAGRRASLSPMSDTGAEEGAAADRPCD